MHSCRWARKPGSQTQVASPDSAMQVPWPEQVTSSQGSTAVSQGTSSETIGSVVSPVSEPSVVDDSDSDSEAALSASPSLAFDGPLQPTQTKPHSSRPVRHTASIGRL